MGNDINPIDLSTNLVTTSTQPLQTTNALQAVMDVNGNTRQLTTEQLVAAASLQNVVRLETKAVRGNPTDVTYEYEKLKSLNDGLWSIKEILERNIANGTPIDLTDLNSNDSNVIVYLGDAIARISLDRYLIHYAGIDVSSYGTDWHVSDLEEILPLVNAKIAEIQEPLAELQELYDEQHGIIQKFRVDPDRFKMWGIKAYDYGIDNVKVDFQDLLVKLSKRRATTIEGEVKPVAAKVRKRNDYLDKLGDALSELSTIQASFESDDKGKRDMRDWMSQKTGNLLKERLGFSCTTYWNEDDRPSSTTERAGFYYAHWYMHYSANKETIEGMVQKVKSTMDGLNNSAQMDMNRLQSLVDRRDEAFTAATELMTNVSDTRGNLIGNL